MSEEETRAEIWESCISEDQQIALYAWSITPIFDGSGNPPQLPSYEQAKEHIAENYKAAIPSFQEWTDFLFRYDKLFSRSLTSTKDLILGKVKICQNPKCRKVYTPKQKSQHFCTRDCGRKFRREVYDLAYRILHRKEINAVSYFWWLNYKERLESDPQEYARYRELKRLSNHRYWEKKHPNCGPYKPHMSKRIPDWAVKGQDVFDHGSVFLSGNMSDEQVMANRDFVLQQNAGEEREHPRVKTVFRK